MKAKESLLELHNIILYNKVKIQQKKIQLKAYSLDKIAKIRS